MEPPRFEDNEATIADFKARPARTVTYLKSIDAAAIDAAADREITFPLGPSNKGHRPRRSGGTACVAEGPVSDRPF